MRALLPLVAKVGLGLLDFFLSRNAAKVESRAAFLSFIASMEKDGLVGAKLNQSYASQRERNRQEIEKQKVENSLKPPTGKPEGQ